MGSTWYDTVGTAPQVMREIVLVGGTTLTVDFDMPATEYDDSFVIYSLSIRTVVYKSAIAYMRYW